MLRAALLAALSLLVAVVIGCGSSSSDGEADPASAVPADAMLYAEVTVRPDGDLREDALDALGKVLNTDDPEGRLRELLDKAIAEADPEDAGAELDYDRDVKPWLGERLGFWFADQVDDEGDPRGALVVTSTDSDAASEAYHSDAQRRGNKLTKRSHAGVDYEVEPDGTATAFTDDFVIVGDEAEVKRTLDASKGDSLADSDRYKSGVGELADERLAHFYLDLKRAFQMAAAQEPNDEDLKQLQALLPFDRLPPVVGSFTANGDRLALDVAIKGEGLDQLAAFGWGSGDGTPLIQELPGDTWAAYGTPDYGKSLKTALDNYAGLFGGAGARRQLEQQLGIDLDADVLDWIGDVAFFARGDSLATLDGGVVIEVADKDKAARGFGKLVGLLQSAGGVAAKPVSIDGAEAAFAVRDASIPKAIVMARSSEKVVITYGPEAAEQALSPSSKLGDTDLYSQAKDSLGDVEPALLLSMPTVISLVDASGGADAEFEQARPYLEAYDVIAYGLEASDDDGRLRVVAGLK